MKTEIILYVADQQKSSAFYSVLLQKKPSLDVPGMTGFDLNESCKLGLMPENGIAKIITPALPHPSTGNGIPRCELYLFTENVDEAFSRGISAGAKNIEPAKKRDWGHIVAYIADPDGHVIAFAKEDQK